MRDRIQQLHEHIGRTIVGQTTLIERLIIALLSDGHVLIEGLPGLAKTTAVRTLASGLTARFQRIQFTPDLIPGDITGTDIYSAHDNEFRFVPGPIFNDIILADEINRAPPKVQSALLEAMQEHQVTVGSTTRRLGQLFTVIATQNPIEHEGTYPLPEAQLDRFLFKLTVDYPTPDEELEILHRTPAGAITPDPVPTLTIDEVLHARHAVQRVYLDAMLERYLIAIVNATRRPAEWAPALAPYITRGASPRASLALALTARAHAFLRGRNFVEPGDIMAMAQPVLCHRIALSFAARSDNMDASQLVKQLLQHVPVP